MTIKTLTKHGNSAASVIGRPILDLPGAAVDTGFEVVTDGKALILTPIEDAELHDRFRKSMDKIGARQKSFAELAK